MELREPDFPSQKWANLLSIDSRASALCHLQKCLHLLLFGLVLRNLVWQERNKKQLNRYTPLSLCKSVSLCKLRKYLFVGLLIISSSSTCRIKKIIKQPQQPSTEWMLSIFHTKYQKDMVQFGTHQIKYKAIYCHSKRPLITGINSSPLWVHQ